MVVFIMIVLLTGERFPKRKPWRRPSKLFSFLSESDLTTNAKYWEKVQFVSCARENFLLIWQLDMEARQDLEPQVFSTKMILASTLKRMMAGETEVAVKMICAGGGAGEKARLWKERRTSPRSSCQGAGRCLILLSHCSP